MRHVIFTVGIPCRGYLNNEYFLRRSWWVGSHSTENVIKLRAAAVGLNKKNLPWRFLYVDWLGMLS